MGMHRGMVKERNGYRGMGTIGSWEMRSRGALVAFLAGAGSGFALAKLVPAGTWEFPGAAKVTRDLVARRQGSMSASIGRLNILLGEIRGLMRSRESSRQPSGTEASSASASQRASTAKAQDAAAGSEGKARSEDSWRRPDQIGYGSAGSAGTLKAGEWGEGAMAMAAPAMAFMSGLATIYFATRREGPAAAWPAAGGFLAGAALMTWRRVAGEIGHRRRSASVVPALAGSRGMRKGRPAIP